MKTRMLSGWVVLLCLASAVVGQEFPAFPQPVKEHEWLQQFVGEWDAKSKAVAGPGQPEMECEGSMKCRTLGGFWIVCDVKNEAMGMTVEAVQTLGYDTNSKKYVGTWVDSMLNHLWKYEGTVDETGKILTLEAEGPNVLQPGKTSKYRDVFEFKSKDLIATSSFMQGDDGKWVTFMTGEMRRKK